MANKVISMQKIKSILQYLIRGYSIRSISRELGLSRPAVTEYVARLRSYTGTLEQLQKMSDAELSSVVYNPQRVSHKNERKIHFEQQADYYLKELTRTGVTRLLLWQEYKAANPDGFGYTQFCVLLSAYRKTAKPVMHVNYTAAEVVMIDFAGDKLYYTDHATGELVSCPVLVCVLPFSNYSFVKALPNASLVQLMAALNDCLSFFGGVPFSLKTDNMKQVVSKASRYEPSFTEAFTQWALYYNIVLTTARVAKPKDKAPVENEVKIAYRRIYAPLRDKVFFSLSELNHAISEQLDIHNSINFQRKNHSRKSCFEAEEKPRLQPLPAWRFEVKHRAQAKVQKNYHITLGEDWHHYSVPCSYIGKKVTAVYDADTVEIYLQHVRIASHKRSYKPHGYSTIKEHMPDGHLQYFEQRGWTPDYFLRQAAVVGNATTQYIQQLLKGKHFTEQTYNACLGIIRLGKNYGNDRLEAACTRALAGEVYSYRTIDNILKNNLDKQAFVVQQDMFQTLPHSNLRGPNAYKE